MRADLRHEGIGHLLAELLESFTHLDGRFVRSMRTLVVRPGELTAAFLRGARKEYLAPIQLFLIANVVYFVLQTWLNWNTLSTSFWNHLNGMPYQQFARSHAQSFALREGMTPEELGQALDALGKAFDGRVGTYSKSLVILLVPIFAVGVALIARSRARGYLPSLVFSLHFLAFFLWLQGLVLLPLADAVRRNWSGAQTWQDVDQLMMIPTVGSFVIYLALSLRGAFGYSKLAAVWRALGLVVAFVVSIFLYRFILFLVVLHTLPASA